jgi:hypothetical protein
MAGVASTSSCRIAVRRCSAIDYTSETTPPYGWQHAEVAEQAVLECAATENPVGIVLGQPSKLVVVDIDVQHGGSLDRFTDRYGIDLAKTRIVATPSGGYHLYYQHPGRVGHLPKRINAGKWIDGLQGVDLLADGHHVQAPPTMRINHPTKPDGAYKLIGDHPVAPLPPRLLGDWLESLTTRRSVDGESVDVAPEQDHSWMVELHRAKVREAAESVPGERDTTVYKCLCVSVRLAWYLPDDLLTVDQVETDYVAAYESAQGDEIVDVPGN